jgi:hypothetical protein
MLSQTQQKVEEQKQQEDGDASGETPQHSTKVLAHGKKKRRITVKRSNKDRIQAKDIHNHIYRKKKARKLYLLLKCLKKRKMAEVFELIKKAEKARVYHKPNFRAMNSVSLSVLPDGWNIMQVSNFIQLENLTQV